MNNTYVPIDLSNDVVKLVFSFQSVSIVLLAVYNVYFLVQENPPKSIGDKIHLLHVLQSAGLVCFARNIFRDCV
jgi:hypothetical protein